jgi:ABC-type dipeptide/oligopeptide/nickel transport system permease subunit
MTQNAQTIAKLDDVVEIKTGESLYAKAFRRLFKNSLTMIMLLILLFLVIFALAGGFIESALDVSYTRTDPMNAFLPIGSAGIRSGTDDLGRDVLARLAYGGQVSLGIAFATALLSLTIGVSLGIISAFYGGWVDDFLVWVITTLNSIPGLTLYVIVSAVLSPGPLTLILALGFLGWTGTMRIVRGETLALREQEFVVSARAVGASDFYIMFNHIFPNLISIVVITLAIDIGSLILAEATLSFLGVGIQPPTPTWGNMLSFARQYLTRGPHLIILPGVLITITVLCLYVIGDGIRDAFDPKLSK